MYCNKYFANGAYEKNLHFYSNTFKMNDVPY
jgi:hypothetical protein